MKSFDVRNFDKSYREAVARKIQTSSSVPKLPEFKVWNYDPCRIHRNGWEEKYFDKEEGVEKTCKVIGRPKPTCRQCGMRLMSHQRQGVSWLYYRKNALLADSVGLGKTGQIAGLLAMLAETGELGQGPLAVGRAIIVPRAPAVGQWQKELNRVAPGLNVVVATGTKKNRIQTYLNPWDVLIIGPEMFRNDAESLKNFKLSLFCTDDIDALRNPKTDTSYFCDRAGRDADRYVIVSATPLQKKLPELHAVLDGIGGLEIFGSIGDFMKRHVNYDTVDDGGNKRVVISGYKGLAKVKEKMAPMVLRRTAKDVKDIALPAIVPDDVLLDLYPSQRAKYKELQSGVLRILKDEGTEVKHTTALTQIHYGAAICAGLASLGEPDGPGRSVKLDWVMDKVSADADLGDEKVVIFAKLKNTVRALHSRLDAEGLKYVTVWGEDPNKDNRMKAQETFWNDPDCRILLGTSAIEQSLNLQVARHLINIDMIMNPARMEQLAGRVRRTGSAYDHVYVHNLLTVNTQEERYLPLLEREAALAGHIWDEKSELFQSLSATELLQLISG